MFNWPISLVAVSILVRWLVAQFPYSGHNSPPMFGDYEAQRHWMEITTNLPIRDWYKNTTDNDLMYWGLDYPPLTAYHMYILGMTSKRLFNSSWTELHTSRGIATYEHKLFMRSTVLISELLIYTPAIIYYFYKTQPIEYQSPPSTVHRQNIQIYTAITLLYPAQILIDHGHFQYNSVFMGLVVWAIIFILNGRQFLAATAFTLALCYKQMSLYYALPFFWMIASSNLRQRPIWKGFRTILLVGLTVMMLLAIVFSPYLYSPKSAIQVISRIFPFNRGIFEDKVANFWFNASIFYKFRYHYSQDQLLKASTALTLLLSLPAGIHLLYRPTIRSFKYSLITTALDFFLFSFQVHEKTILVPALPILLMSREHPQAASWFITISTFSLQPLLEKDGQLLTYFVLMTMYTLLSLELFRAHITTTLPKILSWRNMKVLIYLASLSGCYALNLGALLVKPPERYPHLHQTLNALYSGAHFLAFFLFFYYKQFAPSDRASPERTVKLIKKKN